MAWQQNAKVEPGQAIRCEAWSFKAQAIDFKYHGKCVLAFEDGLELSYNTTGEYNTVQYTEVQTSCRIEEPSEADKSIASGETEVDKDGKKLQKRSPALPYRKGEAVRRWRG
jgi:hypothetical protein